MTLASTLITTEQLMAMPEDGKDRWLINGELREKEMTRRNRSHSRIEARIAFLLLKWITAQPAPHGEVLVGEAGIRLRKNPDTTVGVDVCYIAPETAAASPANYPYVDGVPILIVEVLSPSDEQEEITEKVKSYIEAGVKRVLVVEPKFQTITVYRPDVPPELFNVTQSIDLNQVMTGLRIALGDVFL